MRAGCGSRRSTSAAPATAALAGLLVGLGCAPSTETFGVPAAAPGKVGYASARHDDAIYGSHTAVSVVAVTPEVGAEGVWRVEAGGTVLRRCSGREQAPSRCRVARFVDGAPEGRLEVLPRTDVAPRATVDGVWLLGGGNVRALYRCGIETGEPVCRTAALEGDPFRPSAVVGVLDRTSAEAVLWAVHAEAELVRCAAAHAASPPILTVCLKAEER